MLYEVITPMIKKLLLASIAFHAFIASSQINYTVDVLRLKAYADDCDGGAPFCLNAPQDPIFNIWVTDGGRITSYNVCYTKLLRSFRHDPHHRRKGTRSGLFQAFLRTGHLAGPADRAD